MCKFPLCLELSEALDAAFDGRVYEGAACFAKWGLALVEALHNRHPRGRYPRSLVWHIAHSNLQNLTMNCPCEGLAEAILCNPDAFLRTTLILASRQPSGRKPSMSIVYH
jgi:hypothetical protein